MTSISTKLKKIYRMPKYWHCNSDNQVKSKLFNLCIMFTESAALELIPSSLPGYFLSKFQHKSVSMFIVKSLPVLLKALTKKLDGQR